MTALIKTGWVYLIVNTINGKKYVGCTVQTIARRWWQHRQRARNGSSCVVHQAIRKYGEEVFLVQILEQIIGAREDLIAAEIRHIAEQGSLVPGGYNLTTGGEGLDFSVPENKQRHAAGIKRRSENPEWREVLRKRSADPHWQVENAKQCQNLKTDPELRRAHAEGIAKKFSDPIYQEIQIARTRATTTTEKWKIAHAQGIKKRTADPVWQLAHKEKLNKAWVASAVKVAVRDATLSPEERDRRVKRRGIWRRYREKRRHRCTTRA